MHLKNQRRVKMNRGVANKRKYFIVLFQVNPVPSGAPSPVQIQTNRWNYEVACQDDAATVHTEKADYKITGNKRCFQMNDGMEIFLIADAQKVNK